MAWSQRYQKALFLLHFALTKFEIEFIPGKHFQTSLILDKLQLQDETWAEFSALEMAV